MNKAVLFIHSKTSSKRSSSSQLVPLSKSWANLFNLNIHPSWAHEIPCLGNLKRAQQHHGGFPVLYESRYWIFSLRNLFWHRPSSDAAASLIFGLLVGGSLVQVQRETWWGGMEKGRGRPTGGCRPVLKDKKEFLPFLFLHELHTRRHLCTASVQQSNCSRRVKTILFAKG